MGRPRFLFSSCRPLHRALGSFHFAFVGGCIALVPRALRRGAEMVGHFRSAVVKVCLALVCATSFVDANHCENVLANEDHVTASNCDRCVGSTYTESRCTNMFCDSSGYCDCLDWDYSHPGCSYCENGSCDSSCWWSGELATSSSGCTDLRSSVWSVATKGRRGQVFAGTFAAVTLLVTGFAVHRRRCRNAATLRSHTALATSDHATQDSEHEDAADEMHNEHGSHETSKLTGAV